MSALVYLLVTYSTAMSSTRPSRCFTFITASGKAGNVSPRIVASPAKSGAADVAVERDRENAPAGVDDLALELGDRIERAHMVGAVPSRNASKASTRADGPLRRATDVV